MKGKSVWPAPPPAFKTAHLGQRKQPQRGETSQKGLNVGLKTLQSSDRTSSSELPERTPDDICPENRRFSKLQFKKKKKKIDYKMP